MLGLKKGPSSNPTGGKSNLKLSVGGGLGEVSYFLLQDEPLRTTLEVCLSACPAVRPSLLAIMQFAAYGQFVLVFR